MNRKLVVKTLAVLVGIFLLSAPTVTALDFCVGDIDFDGDNDWDDVFMFLDDWGRNPDNNPCPSDGPAPVPKTGQTIRYEYLDDDGFYERGVECTPRFTDNFDGTVTDNLTGLMWIKCSGIYIARTWQNAIEKFDVLNEYPGQYGYMDWRLPNLKEYLSLVDYGTRMPALPWNHYFQCVHSIENYWTSTTYKGYTDHAWWVNMGDGRAHFDDKGFTFRIWPVRGGHD